MLACDALLSLKPATYEKVAIYVVNQRILNMFRPVGSCAAAQQVVISENANQRYRKEKRWLIKEITTRSHGCQQDSQ